MLESYENLFTEGLHIKHKFIKGFFYEKNLLEYSENRQRLKLKKILILLKTYWQKANIQILRENECILVTIRLLRIWGKNNEIPTT